jgi:ubiquitin-protein ligase
VHIPSDYPVGHPSVQFLTAVWHPSVPEQVPPCGHALTVRTVSLCVSETFSADL